MRLLSAAAALAVATRVAMHMGKTSTGHPIEVQDPDAPLPDRGSVDAKSPHYLVNHQNVQVRFDGKVRSGDVQEYCISEGWIDTRVRNAKGRFKIERGEYVIVRKRGHVEVFRAPPVQPHRKVPSSARIRQMLGPRVDDQPTIDAAEAKRQRKMAKRAEIAARNSK